MRFILVLLLLSYVTLYPLSILRNTINFGQQGNDWNGLCKAGKKQSPINIDTNIIKIPKEIININYSSVAGDVKWNGNFIRLDVKGKQNKITVTDFFTGKTQDYILRRIAIKTPSEHKIKGKKFESEIQFIHLAEDCKVKNDLTIISVFLEKSKKNENDPFLNEFNLNGSATLNSIKKVFDNQKSYFFYEGSQTVPDCKENVNWYVYETPIQASSSFLTQLKKNFCHDHPFGNARLDQNLNGRTIFRYEKPSK